MPAAYDKGRLTVTHDPNQRVDTAVRRPPKPFAGVDTFLEFVTDIAGQILEILLNLPLISDIIEILTGVEDGDLNDLGTWVNNRIADIVEIAEAIVDFIQSIPLIGDILELLAGEDGDLNDLGTAWNNALGMPHGIIIGLWNGLTGQEGGFSGVTQANADDAIAAVREALVSQSSALAQLEAAFGIGTPDADDFERVDADDLGTGWTVKTSGVGTAKIDGHNAVFTIPSTLGASNGEYVARRNLIGATDYSITSIALASASEWQTMLLPTAWGSLDVWARMNAFTTWGTRTGIRARYCSNSTVRLSCFVNGTEMWFDTVAALAPSPGSILQLFCGAGGDTRRFIVTVGKKPVIDYTEASTDSLVGPAYRYRGMGGRGEDPGFLVPPANPGKVMQWTAEG